MASSKQLTLFDMGGWKNGEGGHPPPQQQGPRIPNFAQQGTSSWGRGTGRGRGGGSFDDDGRGRGGKSRGGRGRGRGRGNNSFRSSDSVICLDDDDALCQQALQQCELAESEIARAFREGQNVTNIPGFSRVAGEKWIYPTNRSTRDYQFNISKTALFHNTLVCLPTGLGKTFIAAVVMFNFHRWYPNDLIVFMAPTKPLVKQQLDACHNIVGIDPQVTVELTGSKQSSRRANDWDTKKVFFLTPQVLQSDLQRNESLAEKIRCIVVDEAHKAVGNYSYVQVVSAVVKVNKRFRVLALTATPGNDIQEILKNLLISRIELRTEQSLDVVPYTHNKEVETVVVQLEPYQLSIHEKIKDVFQVYTGKLMQRKILSGNSSCPTAYQLLALRNKFRARPPPHIAQHERGFIEVNFFVCISLAKAIEYLNVHGLRSFYGYLHALLNREKGSAVVASELRKRGVESILEDIKQKLNISVENSSFNVSASGLFDTVNEPNDVSLPPMVASVDVEDYLQSHPKMRELKNIVEKHFEAYGSRNESTRVMIFSQFRGSVQEIGNLLNLLQPKVKPMVFMGQATTTGAGGRGLKQKEQIQVVEKFREGGFNVLVATSVGEEGLDIGDVDLIICFDSNKSPTRNIQRMGRTGRQRKGRIIFLLTSGREERLYRESLMQQSAISKKMTDPEKLRPCLYPISPRMFPSGVEPECVMMNVKLSSEMITDSTKRPHESDSEEDELVEETFDDSDFLRPVKPIKGKKKKTMGKKKNIVKSVVVEEEKPLSKEAQALKKCFEKMETKMLEKAKTDTIVLSDEDDDDFNLGNSQPVPIFIDHDSGKNEYYDIMCSLFDIHDTTASSSVPPCTYVPLKPAVFSWKEEYNVLNVEDLLLKEIHLHCVREVVDSTVLTGAIGRYCKCGNIGTSKKYEEQENCFDEMETEEVWTSRPPVPQLTKSPNKNPLQAIQQLSSAPLLVKSPETINFVSLPKSIDEKASLSHSSREDRCNRFAQYSLTQDIYPACVEQNSTAVCGDEDVFDDDLDEFFILNEIDPMFLNGECNREISSATVIKSPNATVSGQSAKCERTPIMPNLVVTPVVRKNINSPDVIPCSDDSSTASESEFENQDSTYSKYFTLKSKSEQHFANYKQKCAATAPQFRTFQIRPPAGNKGSRLPLIAASQAQDNSNKLVASQSNVSETLESCRKDRSHVASGMSRFRSSPNLGCNKSFTFKRVTSAKRSGDPGIPPRASPELASQSMLSGGPSSPVAAIISPTERCGSPGCVLATSSDDEDFGLNSKDKSEDDHSDADSDETRWDPDELPPSPVLCRSQQSFQDLRSSSAPEVKGRKSLGLNPDISPDSCHNKTSASNLDDMTVNMQPNGTPTKWMLNSQDFRHSNHVADDTQDVIFIGTSANKGSPSRLESSSSHEFLQPPTNKKPKFVFQRKPNKIEQSPLGRSKYFISPVGVQESPKRPASSLPAASSDDFTAWSGCVSPVPMSPARAAEFESPDVNSPDFVVRRKNNVRRPIMYSDERPSQQLKPTRRKTKQRVRNPFVLEEAEGTSDDSSGDDRNDFANSVDASFVVYGDEDEEDADTVSSSQQHAMYLRSVKDVVPVRLGRIENPLPPQERYLDETDYMNDSFCDDDVEFADVGVYTQAMVAAREEVDNERRNGRSATRRLRSRR